MNFLQQLYQVFLEPAVRTWLNKRGLIAGDLQGGRNLYDVLQDDQFQRDLHTAMFGAAQADRPGHEQLLRGFMHLAGKPLTTEAEKRIQALSGDFAQLTPYLARWAPGLHDQLFGSRGSVA